MSPREEVVERLRSTSAHSAEAYGCEEYLPMQQFWADHAKLSAEAADTIEALSTELEELRKALEPFAKEADARERLALGEDIDHWSLGENNLTLGDIRRARTALNGASK